MNLITFTKKRLLLSYWILLITCLFSIFLMFIGSLFLELKIMTIIGISFLLMSYLLLMINIFLIINSKEKILLFKKFKRTVIGSLLMIPCSFFFIGLACFGILYIPTSKFPLSLFYTIYPYFYFFPMIFVVLNWFINFRLYLKEKQREVEIININKSLETKFEHNDCSICNNK